MALLVPEPDPAACANCGAALAGEWCSSCGQRRVERRLHLREVLRDLWDKILDLETGYLHTAWTSLVRPERVVLDWLHGRRRPYTPPLRFVLVNMSLSLLVTTWLVRAVPLDAATRREMDQIRDMTEGIGLGAMDMEAVMRWTQWSTLALLLPALAGATALAFRAWRRTFAEHLAAASYVYGAWGLLGTLVMVSEAAAGLRTGGGLYPVAMLTAPLWIGWALARVHPGEPRAERFGRVLATFALCLAATCALSCALTVVGMVFFLALR